MNFKTFLAMLGRDFQVARRNLITLLLQTFLQPLMFVFIFGRVMVGSGFMPPAYKSLLLPSCGIHLQRFRFRLSSSGFLWNRRHTSR